MKNKLLKMNLAIGITILFIILSVTPMVVGYKAGTTTEELKDENYVFNRFDKHCFPETYNPDEKDYLDLLPHSFSPDTFSKPETVTKSSMIETRDDGITQISSSDGPMDSPWSMYGHDVRHTSRSPYSTVDTWDEIWRYTLSGSSLQSAPVIDSDGMVYVGREGLYAIYPNGTLKWKYDLPHTTESAPAIDGNGVLYIGTVHAMPNYLYAIYTSNGTLKWKYVTGNHVGSSPVIGIDGIIYISDWNGNIHAVYPNGTRKWVYHTGDVVTSSPALGEDGTIYCGSHDDHVYALYSNNGTVKWSFDTGSWVHGSPTIGTDGTVYIGSDNGYLYALYPNNGTMKWRCSIGATWCSPSLDDDGTLYVGVFQEKFYAIYSNGTVKWKYDAPGRIWFGNSAAISSEGIIYFGTTWMDGGEGAFIALNPDGSERWNLDYGLMESSPAIGEDGTVYIGSSGAGYGYLYAFGRGELEADANGPYYGLVDEPVQFTGSADGGYSPYTWHWDFGDDHTSEEQNPTHIYTADGNYTITLTVTDNTSNSSSDITWAWIQETNAPPNKPTIDGPTSGKAGTSYDYTVTATDPNGTPLWYYVDWGDDTNSGWIGPYASGQEMVLSHTWDERGTYTIRAKAKDPYEAEGPWGTLQVTMPRNKIANRPFFNFLENHPNMFPLLRQIIGGLNDE